MKTIKNTLAGTFALVATFITVAAATPLRAEPAQARVAYSDLDIRSEAGASKLDARIRRAAHEVCGRSDIGNSIAVAACRHQAIDNAKAKVAVAVQGSEIKLAAR